jgi:restriction endonuclease S subunit
VRVWAEREYDSEWRKQWREAIVGGSIGLAIRSPMCQAQIWGKVKMTAEPCLYINRINSLPIPFPPLAEQHRIVAKVGELMSLCDQLEPAQAERESQRDRLTRVSLRRPDEQQPVVARVDKLMALCDRLEAQPTTARTECRRLLEAVLHQALASVAQAKPSNLLQGSNS